MKLTGVTPNLVTNDIPRAVAFYRDVLGFSIRTTVPDAAPFVFVLLERDGVNVFLNDLKTVRDETPAATSLVVGQSGVGMFFLIDDATAMWEQVRERAPVIMALKDQWYGMREFTVTDPDGYVVTFAERR
jgi:uncharacterized glyoxalase superfamily protein PhnB